MSQEQEPIKQVYQSDSLADTERIGTQIADNLSVPACIYLEGDLGTGKTTLCKTIIKSLGYQRTVTSPTYNLIQEYPIDIGMAYHMDLYRLQSPEELEFLAIADLWRNDSLFLVEWPERGQLFLPEPTHKILLNKNNEHVSNKSRVITMISV